MQILETSFIIFLFFWAMNLISVSFCGTVTNQMAYLQRALALAILTVAIVLLT